MDEPQRIAEAVAQILGESGVSNTEFARRAGIDRVTLERLLEGKVKRPHRATLSKIATASGREWDALVKVAEGEPLPPPPGVDDRLGTLVVLLEQQSERLADLEEQVRRLAEQQGRSG